jgi:hypothetical protein
MDPCRAGDRRFVATLDCSATIRQPGSRCAGAAGVQRSVDPASAEVVDAKQAKEARTQLPWKR